VSIQVLIPAGGTGSRFGSPVPKQFLPLAGKLVLEWSLLPFLATPTVDAVWVALANNVPAQAEGALARLGAAYPGRLKLLACAGATRALTVAGALEQMAAALSGDPWILVHDAARPGLPSAALARLVDALQGEAVGALLALPLADTLKRANAQGRVDATLPRAGLWQAQTPQAFRLALLREALLRAGAEAGDEATAIEALGLHPRLVEGDAQNLKLTRPGDGALIAAVLAAREIPCA
jgi:2-C-methyl-D-erythritol 4-phosphate cytidylyltransferase